VYIYIYTYTVEITNALWSWTLWHCVLPKHVAEVHLMFVLIKDGHLVGIINYVRRTHIHVYVQHTSRLSVSSTTHTYMCMSNIPVRHSTAHILVYVRPKHQYASVQPHMYVYVQYTSTSFNCTYTPMCTSNKPVCVSSTTNIYIYAKYTSMLVQLPISSYMYVQHTSMRQFN
jgi:hypothetical protein